MDFSFKGIEKLLQDIEERKQKRQKKLHYIEIGYSPKCTVCNDPKLTEIEKLREENYTLKEIKDELQLDCSIMALSRHFKNHYPKSQAYKEKQQLLMLENIKEAYIKYPFLEEYFKDKDLEFLQCFNKYDGFCTDRFNLCQFIPPGTVNNCNGTIFKMILQTDDEIKEKASGSYFGLDKDKENEIKLKYQNRINQCLICKDEINERRLNLLERIITYNFLNIPPDNKEMYFNLINFNGTTEEFIDSLEAINNENQQGK